MESPTLARVLSSPDPRRNRESLAAWIGDAATAALANEAVLAGKPGLVGPQSRGAHADMDLDLMLSSAEVLRPWFRAMSFLALSSDEVELPRILPALRPLGKLAEAEMFRATGGVNTHKGAIFALGLLSVSATLILARRPSVMAVLESAPPPEPLLLGDLVRAIAGALASGIVDRELLASRENSCRAGASAGERLFREHGARGARGQAEAGYPIVGSAVLPPLRLSRGLGPSERSASAMEGLLGAMCELDDTCVLSRGGPEGLAIVREGAASALLAGASTTAEGRAAIALLDATLVARNLSPGGSADMLAAAFFLDSVESAFSQ